MPDLSLKGSQKYWKEYQDKTIYRVLAFMETVEKWTHDGDPDVEKEMLQLGEELENISKLDMNTLDHEDEFVDIANNLHMSRALMMLQAVDAIHPGAASKVLVYAEDKSEKPDDAPGLFLRRNVVFERLRLIGRIFSRERIALMMRVLEGEEHEG